MSRDPYVPPASKEEQFSEIARILGVALHRWHTSNQGKIDKSERPPNEPAPSDDPQPEEVAKSEQLVAASRSPTL